MFLFFMKNSAKNQKLSQQIPFTYTVERFKGCVVTFNLVAVLSQQQDCRLFDFNLKCLSVRHFAAAAKE